VGRDLKKLGRAQARHILDEIESKLADDADSHPALKGPFAGMRKFRVGDYRVIYCIIDSDVVILRIAHRKEAYR
jgi:mRNA interferase RelE/StbE